MEVPRLVIRSFVLSISYRRFGRDRERDRRMRKRGWRRGGGEEEWASDRMSSRDACGSSPRAGMTKHRAQVTGGPFTFTRLTKNTLCCSEAYEHLHCITTSHLDGYAATISICLLDPVASALSDSSSLTVSRPSPTTQQLAKFTTLSYVPSSERQTLTITSSLPPGILEPNTSR